MSFFSTQATSEILSFGWGEGVAGLVRSRISDTNGDSVMRYEIKMKVLSTDEYEIVFKKPTLEIDGNIQQPVNLIKMLPSIVISKEGDFRRLKGISALNVEVLNKIPIKLNERDRKNWERNLNKPNVLQSMHSRTERMWNTWVGAWNGLRIDNQTNLSPTLKFESPQGNTLVTYEYVGLVENVCTHCVKLRCISTVDGDAAIKYVLKSLEDRDDDLDGVLFEKAISQTVTEIITDSLSLIPYYATTLTTVNLKVAEEAEVSNQIRQEYWFDWQ